MRSGSYERQTTPPPLPPLWLTNWREEGEGSKPDVHASIPAPSVRLFTRSARRRPSVRPFPLSFFFIFGGKPHPINNEERARRGDDKVGNEKLEAGRDS